MDTKALPTTGLAVQADLEARADFRGIDKAGQIHYLYGMATQLLAQANTDRERLRSALRALIVAVDSDEGGLDRAADRAEGALTISDMRQSR